MEDEKIFFFFLRSLRRERRFRTLSSPPCTYLLSDLTRYTNLKGFTLFLNTLKT